MASASPGEFLAKSAYQQCIHNLLPSDPMGGLDLRGSWLPCSVNNYLLPYRFRDCDLLIKLG